MNDEIFIIVSIDEFGFLNLEEILDLLNRQQSIIRKDRISIETMMSNMEKLEKENEKLRKNNEQLKEKLRECIIRLDRFNCG